MAGAVATVGYVLIRFLAIGLVSGAVWRLPPGDRLWPLGVLACFSVQFVAAAMGRGGGRGARAAEPIGPFLGLGVFIAVVPSLGLPYRPAVLFPLIGGGLAGVYGTLCVRLVRKHGWPVGLAVLACGLGLGLVVGGFFLLRALKPW